MDRNHELNADDAEIVALLVTQRVYNGVQRHLMQLTRPGAELSWVERYAGAFRAWVETFAIVGPHDDSGRPEISEASLLERALAQFVAAGRYAGQPPESEAASAFPLRGSSHAVSQIAA